MGERRLLPRARGQANPGAVVYRGRRPPRVRVAGRGDQLWILAAGVRRRPGAGPQANAQRQAGRGNRRDAGKLLRRGGGAELRRSIAGVFAAFSGNKESAGFEYSVVALGDRKTRSFVAGGTSGSAPWSGLAGDFCGDAAAGLSEGEREGLSRDEADGRTFGGRCLDAARDVYRAAADLAGNLRVGAADYVREPGQPDAGTDQRA